MVRKKGKKGGEREDKRMILGGSQITHPFCILLNVFLEEEEEEVEKGRDTIIKIKNREGRGGGGGREGR